MTADFRTDDIRVFAVDDHAAMLRAVATVIDATDGFVLVGTAMSGTTALVALDDGPQPDLLLIDVQMPGLDGVQTARRYCEGHDDVTIILMSAADLDALPVDVLGGGVSGFLPKSTLSPHALHNAWARAHGPSS